MSDENFIERWSRRKREAAERDERAAKDAAGERTSEQSAREPERHEPQPPATEKLPFDPACLPPIESITAASDIRAFLAPGVPAELTRAALRRAWVADPAIRDFIGLSENAWDFNAPGGVPGFDAISGSEDLRRLVAQLTGDTASDRPEEQNEASGGETGAAPQSPQSIDDSATLQPVRISAPDAETRQIIEEHDQPARDVVDEQADLLQHKNDDAAPQHERADSAHATTPQRRAHGRALPE
jgi:hypothetical protein